ncbi:NUDIX hydrolase [Thermomonospora cellulosilytica]|nr:NUDIX domain-containing protein [Thermomonospora cellulosilytica]
MSDRHRTIVDVHVLLTRSDGRILMMERANTGYADGQAGLPSGHLEDDETVLDAAIREAEEEVGVSIEPGDLTCVHVCHLRRAGEEARIGFFFATSRWRGEPANCEPHKCARTWWADPAALPCQTLDYIAHAIPRIRQGQGFSVYGDWD